MKNPKDIMIGERTLAEVLERHKHWLNQDCDGWNDMRAILRGSDLSGSDLRGSDLSGSDLRGSDLSDSDLRGSDLSYSDLSGSDLRDNDLRGSDLRDSDLRDSDLRGSDLSGSDLRGSNLSNARNSPYIPMICPEEGTFIGWKKVMIQGGLFLAKLEIPEDAARSSATTRKCRASKANVLGLYRLNGERLDDDVEAVSIYDNSLIYKAKTVVIPDSWDDNRWNECSKGIHFFMQRQEAINY